MPAPVTIPRPIRAWLLAGALGCLVVVPSVHSFDIARKFSLPKSAVILVAGALMLLPLAYALLFSGAHRQLRRWVAVALGVDVLSVLVSLAFTRSRHSAFYGSFDRMDGALEYAAILTVTLGLWIAIDGDLGRLRLALRAVALAALPVFVLGSGQTVFLRASGTLGNPDYFANYDLFPLFVALGLAASAFASLRGPAAGASAGSSRRPGALLEGVTFAAVASAAAYELYATKTVGALVGAAVGAFVFLLCAIHAFARGPLWRGRAGVVAAMVTLASSGAAVAVLRRALAGNGTASGRTFLWHDALAVLPGAMWTGAGFDNFREVFMPHASRQLYQFALNVDTDWDTAHSTPLQILVTRGVLGLGAYLALLAIFAASMVRALRSARTPGDRLLLGGIASAYAAYAVHNLANVDISATRLYGYAFLLLGAAAPLCWPRASAPPEGSSTAAGIDSGKPRRRLLAVDERAADASALLAIGDLPSWAVAGLGAAAIGAVAGAASWMTDLLGADHEYALARTYGTYNGPDPETRREAPSQALVHAKAAAKQAPSEPRYRLEVALASIKLAQVVPAGARKSMAANALAAARVAAESPDKISEAQSALGVALMLSGDLPHAAEAIEAAFAEAPLLLGERLTYARILATLGRLREAQAQVAMALELRPADPSALALKRSVSTSLRRSG